MESRKISSVAMVRCFGGLRLLYFECPPLSYFKRSPLSYFKRSRLSYFKRSHLLYACITVTQDVKICTVETGVDPVVVVTEHPGESRRDERIAVLASVRLRPGRVSVCLLGISWHRPVSVSRCVIVILCLSWSVSFLSSRCRTSM